MPLTETLWIFLKYSTSLELFFLMLQHAVIVLSHKKQKPNFIQETFQGLMEF